MDKTSFTPYQQKVIDLMARVNSDEQMSEINDILSKYFAQKAISMTDKLWEEGTITENTIEAWKNEHLRTPYNSY